jgi:HrpA-like RNA helicase
LLRNRDTFANGLANRIVTPWRDFEVHSDKEDTMSNMKLPIDAHEDEIVGLLKDHQVVIVVAETGAGKSTRVPQFLLRCGYKVIMTQPRRMAARTVAERIAEELGCKIGGLVGYRTAEEKDKSGPDTRCLVATDGLVLRYMLHDNFQADVLILDELHEWNTNMEVLVAWMKKRMNEGSKTKLVIQSATLDAEDLADFFGGAPIVRVPGRTYPVTERRPQGSLEDDVASLLENGLNVLVFQPGKAEIEECIEAIRRKGVQAEFMALHGEQTPAEQGLCFRHYDRSMCIVATSVAQTSVTIPNIDAVVDSGVVKQISVQNGVEGLHIDFISKADREQRKGRAGRTKPGIYIDHCPVSLESRPRYREAEILRSPLEHVILRLAKVGVDTDNLRFFHLPNPEEVAQAKRVLSNLGCMHGSKVTKLGAKVADLPLNVRAGRMVVEAVERGVVGDVIIIAAILEVGGIIDRNKFGARNLTRETSSDCLAHLQAFKKARDIRKEDLRASGIHVKNYFKVIEQRRLLQDALTEAGIECATTGDRESIVLSICAGMVDKVYSLSGVCATSLERHDRREIDKNSVVASEEGQFVVGTPFDIGRFRLLTMNTLVTLDQLTTVAPDLLQVEVGAEPYYNERHRMVMSHNIMRFGDSVLSTEERQHPDHPEASRIFAEWLADRILNAAA